MSLTKAVGIVQQNAYLGKKRDNKTDVTLVNNTLKNQDVTVPAGEEWTVLGGQIYNGDDVARNCNVICYDSANVEMSTLHADAALAATTRIQFPRANQAGAVNPLRTPCVLEAADYVRFQFKAGGISTGGTGLIVLHVLVRKA